MQSSTHLAIENDLRDSIFTYYKNLRRDATFFVRARNDGSEGTYLHFLVDRRHVLRYGFSFDRGMWVGGLQLGIGPGYFAPAYFWSYEDSTRFSMELDSQSVFRNLRLLDEFLRSDTPRHVIT
jgi:hypothetical protein